MKSFWALLSSNLSLLDMYSFCSWCARSIVSVLFVQSMQLGTCHKHYGMLQHIWDLCLYYHNYVELLMYCAIQLNERSLLLGWGLTVNLSSYYMYQVVESLIWYVFSLFTSFSNGSLILKTKTCLILVHICNIAGSTLNLCETVSPSVFSEKYARVRPFPSLCDLHALLILISCGLFLLCRWSHSICCC